MKIRILLFIIAVIILGFSLYVVITNKQIIAVPVWVYLTIIFSSICIIENIKGYSQKLQECFKRINKKYRAICADWFKKWSCKLIAWSNKINCSDKKSEFHQQYLIPVEKEDDVYSQLLCEAIRDKDVQNIAITGPYGSGKSSVIKAFQKSHPEYKYLNLSLANFQEQKANPAAGDASVSSGTSTSEELSAVENQLIEASILQQMFYQVRRKRIPDSRFKRINRLSGRTCSLWTLLVCLWLLSLYVVRKTNWIDDTGQAFDVVNVIALGFFIFGFIIALRYVVRFVNRSHFKAFKVEKCGMEISGGTEVSILNKHLDEILYYFEVTKFNIVIIEDLDRFEKCSIFTKLRELNALINKSEDINRRVVFIYAIKDDMFKDKERTKFFDYILPIIPYINKSNSAGKFIQLFESAGFLREVEKTFLEEIAIFIDDMRLLNNIFNEYEVYRNKLSKIINNNKLLAIIVYKNTCPKDFSDLHFGNSVINQVFDQKGKIIGKKREEIQKKIDELRKQLEQAKQEHLANEKELRMLILGGFKIKYPQIAQIYYKNHPVKFEQLLDEKIFELLINGELKEYIGASVGNILLSELEKCISPDFSYKKRLTNLQNRLKVHSGNINSQIDKYNQEISSLSKCTYAELADKITLKEKEGEVKENENLLKFLLIGGYIDEDYNYYISFFHLGDITPEDWEFIGSLKSGNEKPYTYHLFEKESIAKKLKLSDFARRGIINLDLLEFLLSNKQNYTEKTGVFLRQLREKEQLPFINEFIGRGKHAEKLINWLCQNWAEFWKYLLSDGNLSEEKEKQYWITIFNHVDEESINRQNLEEEMTAYINQLTDFFKLTQLINDQDKLCNLIDSLNVSIEEMDEPVNEKVYKYLLKGRHYAINLHNISAILHREVSDIAENDIKMCNYTTIINSNCVDLIEYVKAEINSYVEKINLEIDACSYESEENFVLLLNNETLKIENKRLLIERYCRVLKDFSEINDKALWSPLLQKELVEKTWENVSVYWEYCGLDEFVIDFLNKKGVMDSLVKTDADDLTEEFVQEFVKNGKINYDTFKTYLDSDCPKYMPTDITEMAENKVLYLIENHMLDMNIDNYETLKDSFPEISFVLVENNKDEYFGEYKKYELSDIDAIKILNSEGIENPDKIKIIKHLDIQKVENSLNLCKAIAVILAEYSEWDEMDDDLIAIILQREISMKEKVMIVAHRIGNYEITEETLEAYMSLLDEPYSQLYKSRKKIKLNDTPFNNKLIEYLKLKKIVRNHVLENGQFIVETRWNKQILGLFELIEKPEIT